MLFMMIMMTITMMMMIVILEREKRGEGERERERKWGMNTYNDKEYIVSEPLPFILFFKLLVKTIYSLRG